VVQYKTQGGFSMFTDLTTLFCSVDDFCKIFEPKLQATLLMSGEIKRIRNKSLTLSEIMTIVVLFHISRFRDFKHYYLNLLSFHRSAFPGLVSYNRFVELMPSALVGLCAYLNSRKGSCTGIQFVDSTSIIVCNNKRIFNHKVFEAIAQRGKNTMGWFFGFKLHIIVSDIGELLGFKLTPANTDDREPLIDLSEGLFGKLFGDKGYISKVIFETLFAKGLQLITPIRRNMKNKLMPLFDKLLLRKRSIVETINDQLKNISQIEHTRHRSIWNFMVNLVAGLIAYSHQEKKPSIRIGFKDLEMCNTLVIL
jgi:Transposase DDE domain